MKIGIIYTSADVDNYGGFTFMNEILNSLLDFSESNNHSFVILTDSKKIQKQKIKNQNIKIVYFPYFQSGLSDKIIVGLPQLIRLILHKLRHPLSDSDLGSARNNFLEKQRWNFPNLLHVFECLNNQPSKATKLYYTISF